MKPIEGVDFAYGSPSPAALKAAGKRFVCRYVSQPGNTKNLQAAEARSLLAAGLGVVVVYEGSAGEMLDGRAAGEQAASTAREQARTLGLDDGPIYFACDFDAQPAQQAAINDYLDGAASVIGAANVGIYGGYGPVKRALDARKAAYAWQTYAWSGGEWDARAQLQQYENGVTVAGTTVDLDRATAKDYGQRPRPRQPAKPEEYFVVLAGRVGRRKVLAYSRTGRGGGEKLGDRLHWVSETRKHKRLHTRLVTRVRPPVKGKTLRGG